jgi:putative oxidoreductase
MNELFLVGRIVFGGYFAYSGITHFLSGSMMAQYAASKGVPLPEAAVFATGLLILAGGLSVMFGVLPHIGALCIALFLVGVSPMMHNFWAVPDPNLRMVEMVNFTKNMALLGGVLMLLGVPRPWPYSLENRRRVVV